MGFSAAKRHGATIVASIALHGALTGVASWATYRSLAGQALAAPALSTSVPTDPTQHLPVVELATMGDGFLVEDEVQNPIGDPPQPPSGNAIAHPDTDAPGLGGDPTAHDAALNFAESDERMRLSPDLRNHLDRDQVQRLRVARARTSWEDRRATTHPAELTFVANGTSVLRGRRPASPSSPSRGALESPAASARGGTLGATRKDENEPAEPLPGGQRTGSLRGAPGAGVLEGVPGEDHRVAAPTGSARPSVTPGPVAVIAALPGRPKDDTESEQAVATTLRALVHASTAGGPTGDGNGGRGGGGPAGAGGETASGFQVRALGFGDGDVFDYFTGDPRLVPYFRRIHAKIDPLWANAFPKSALLELKQGTVILEFTVASDGRVAVSWPPVRASGIDEFDRNCADAIRRAGPLPPIPDSLGVSRLRIRAPFVASNPIIK